jgi:hypothetical protein
VVGHWKSEMRASVVATVLAIVFAVPIMARGASKAPEFSLPTAEGTNYSSAAHKGHRIVISFYKGFY